MQHPASLCMDVPTPIVAQGRTLGGRGAKNFQQGCRNHPSRDTPPFGGGEGNPRIEALWEAVTSESTTDEIRSQPGGRKIRDSPQGAIRGHGAPTQEVTHDLPRQGHRPRLDTFTSGQAVEDDPFGRR